MSFLDATEGFDKAYKAAAQKIKSGDIKTAADLKEAIGADLYNIFEEACKSVGIKVDDMISNLVPGVWHFFLLTCQSVVLLYSEVFSIFNIHIFYYTGSSFLGNSGVLKKQSSVLFSMSLFHDTKCLFIQKRTCSQNARNFHGKKDCIQFMLLTSTKQLI